MPHAGFTLLEVLVAFVIISLALVAVLRGGALGLANVDIASRTEHAVSLAQSRLASLDLTSVHPAEDLHGDDGSYHWRLELAPLVSIPVRPVGRNQPEPTILYHLAVTISWMADRRLSSIRLETDRLTPVPPILP